MSNWCGRNVPLTAMTGSDDLGLSAIPHGNEECLTAIEKLAVCSPGRSRCMHCQQFYGSKEARLRSSQNSQLICLARRLDVLQPPLEVHAVSDGRSSVDKPENAGTARLACLQRAINETHCGCQRGRGATLRGAVAFLVARLRGAEIAGPTTANSLRPLTNSLATGGISAWEPSVYPSVRSFLSQFWGPLQWRCGCGNCGNCANPLWTAPRE
jgi:hypothetical protein